MKNVESKIDVSHTWGKISRKAKNVILTTYNEDGTPRKERIFNP